MDMYEVAQELHVHLYDVARWVVTGKLRSRVPDTADRPSVWNVEVCEADVNKLRRNGHVTQGVPDDPKFDEFRAQTVLRQRHGRFWPPRGWLETREAIKRSNPRSHPSSRRMGRTEDERVKEVLAMIKKVGADDVFEWAPLAVVCRKLAKRKWAQDSTVVRDIVDMLVNTIEVEARTVQPRVGRPSYQIRIIKES
jgi:hypothetical protein